MITRTMVINWSIEFGPIMLFFVSLALFGESHRGFVNSVALFTIATIISLIVAYLHEGRIAIFAMLAGAFIIAFGAATVYLDNPYIFIVKDTAYNAFFAMILVPGLCMYHRGDLKLFFNALFDLTPEGWWVLSRRWFFLFLVIVISNEIVWRLYDQNVWVIYKFCSTVAQLGFGFCQIPFGKKYRMPTASPWGVRLNKINDAEE